MAHTTTTATPPPTGVVEHLDPRTLLIDSNVRDDARVDEAFIYSIRDLGVLQPIIAVRAGDGRVRVRFGHRRTVAAIEADHATVPVIVAADESTDDEAQVERLISQWAENEHRTGLSTAEQVGVIEQLSAFGVSAAKIAKRTRLRRAHVDAALTVAGSDLAKTAAGRYDFLDVLQAAVVAEFDGEPEAIKALVAAAQTGQFQHVAQRLRDQRAEAQRRAAAEQELRDGGVAVIDKQHGDGAVGLDRLTTAEGEQLDPTNHADCRGHAAYVTEQHGYVDPTTGRPAHEADPDDEDWAADEEHAARGDDPLDQNSNADADRTELVWDSYLVTRYVCTDPTAHGHVDRYASTYDRPEAKIRMADLPDDEQEIRRAERRDVIESNKAWASAETVRRDWLRTFLTRKTAPKGTAAFIATALAGDRDIVTSIGARALVADMLGLPEPTGYGAHRELVSVIDQASEQRAQVLVLAQILAAYEDRTDRNDWRDVQTHTTRYLRFIQAHGYDLSPVEVRACGEAG